MACDYRLDRRDGRCHLLDFNPSMGAQFRLLEGDNGIDVMCALHLDLTGRPVPAGHPVEGRTYMGRPALPSLLRIQAEVKAASRHPW